MKNEQTTYSKIMAEAPSFQNSPECYVSIFHNELFLPRPKIGLVPIRHNQFTEGDKTRKHGTSPFWTQVANA